MDSREAPPLHQQSGGGGGGAPPNNNNMMMGPTSYSSSAMAASNHHHHHPHHHQQQQQHHHHHNPMIGSSAAAHMMGGAGGGGGGGGPARFPFSAVTPPPPQQQQPAVESLGGGGGGFDGSSSPPGMRPGGGGGGFSIDSGTKKKRGRPRKYSPDGNIALGLTPTPTPMSSSGGGGGAHVDSGGTGASSEPSGSKKHRGRPPGSGKRQLDALGAGGIGFTPHVILVQTGEDVASKIMEFSQQGPRTVCILSANGAVTDVFLRQANVSGGVNKFEGRFEIISLSGSFVITENNGHRTRTGSLSLSVAGIDGRVIGGGVTGQLIAASPVQVIVGSFVADGKKSGANNASLKSMQSASQAQMLNFGAHMAVGSPPSHGDSSESSEDNANTHTPLNRGPGFYNNVAQQPLHNMNVYSLWNGQTQQ